MKARRHRIPHPAAALAAALALAGCAAAPDLAPVDLGARGQAEAVLARLSDADKVALTHGCATMYLAANPRKGIPEELAFTDGPFAIRAEMRRDTFAYARAPDDLSDAATVFPALSALAETWDPALARRFGQAMGEQARARGKDVILGPGLNLARTPLCGRNYEYLGEDPALAAALAVPIVQGIQSRDVAACVKHFAVNSQELNRNAVDARPSPRALRELYLPAFEAAVKQGGALCVMGAYNRLNGIPCSHNAWLNDTLLKGEWGFPGPVVSDWGSLHDTLAGALGGTDLEMNAGRAIRFYKAPLLRAVREGRLPRARLDDMARRVLYLQAKLHKLDGRPRAPGAINTPEHQALAREIAAASVTLLKNDAELLPLQAEGLRRILVVGAAADAKLCAQGWSAEGKPPHETTLLQGLRRALPHAEIRHAPFPALPAAAAAIPEACLLTEDPDPTADAGALRRGWLWQRFDNDALRGAPAAQGFAPAPALPAPLPRGPCSIRWKTRLRAPETGPYRFLAHARGGLRLRLDGDLLLDAWQDAGTAPLAATRALRQGHVYTLTLEYRRAGGEPGPTLGWNKPSEFGAGHAELLAQARAADLVILATGNLKGHGPALEGEGADRPDLDLLPQDDAAIPDLLAANPRTLVLVQSGAPVRLPWLGLAHTLLHHSFLGQEGGDALADVLLGRREPTGRLIHTWPRRLQDSPAHALGDYGPDVARHREGILVGYRWFDAKRLIPAFPFGYGLSAAAFSYADPHVTVDADGATLRLTIQNTAERPGTAVAQVYLEPPLGSTVPRAPRALAAFRKLRLGPGESERLTFLLPHRAFAYWDETLPGWRHEAGIFAAAVGDNSRDLPLRAPIPLPAWECPVRKPPEAPPAPEG